MTNDQLRAYFVWKICLLSAWYLIKHLFFDHFLGFFFDKSSSKYYLINNYTRIGKQNYFWSVKLSKFSLHTIAPSYELSFAIGGTIYHNFFRKEKFHPLSFPIWSFKIFCLFWNFKMANIGLTPFFDSSLNRCTFNLVGGFR